MQPGEVHLHYKIFVRSTYFFKQGIKNTGKSKKKNFFWVMPEYSKEKENNNSGSVPAPELASLTLLLFAVKLPFL